MIKVVYAPVTTQFLPAAQVDHGGVEGKGSVEGAEVGERSSHAVNSAQRSFFIGLGDERSVVLIDTKFPLTS